MTTTTQAVEAQPRLSASKLFPSAYRAMLALDSAVDTDSPLEIGLLDLLKIRISQVNGCAYCLDMHTKDARHRGESDERMHLLVGWRESPQFTQRERAALQLAEAITLLTQGHVSDDVWAEAEKEFSPEELAALVWSATVMNAWNRIGVSTRLVPGNYQPK